MKDTELWVCLLLRELIAIKRIQCKIHATQALTVLLNIFTYQEKNEFVMQYTARILFI